MDWKNAKRLLDGECFDTRGVLFSAYTAVTRGASKRGSGDNYPPRNVPARDRVKIARNTWLERGAYLRTQYAQTPFSSLGYPDNAIGVRLHETYIVIHTPHWTELNTGGWSTMTTRERIEAFSPVQIGASRGGWTVYLYDPGKPCFCVRDAASERASGNGIVIHGEHSPGLALSFTGKYFRESSNAKEMPVYEWRACQHCDGTEILGGFDFASGGHPYFDGIRISPDGSRLMREQPNRPPNFEPVKTVSGWSGEPNRARRAHEPFWRGPSDPMVGRVNYDPVRGA